MKRLLLLILCATLCHAASVTIAESTYADASGRLATGTITISWPSFSSGTSNIAAGSTTVTVAAGVLSVLLVANDTADPPFNYTASFRLQTSSYSQQWKVPTVAGPLTIQSVTWSSNSPVTVGLDQLRRTGYSAGDIAYYDGTLWKRLPRGTDGQALTIDTSLSTYLKWATTAGSGDFSTTSASSVDSEVVLFSGTGGKTGKRATISGLGKFSSGVLSAAVAGTDYESPITAGTTLQYLRGDKSLATFSSAAQSAMSGLYEVPLTFAARLNRSVNTIDLATGIVTPGSCGDTTHSCGLTLDTYGRVTGATNNAIATSGTGDVVGPSSATDNCFARFDTTTGKLIQNGSVCADDSGNITTPGNLTSGVGNTAGSTASLGNTTGDTGASSWTINSGDGASNTEPGYLKIRSSHTTKRSAYLFPCTDADGFYCIASSTPVADSTDIIATKANTVTFTGKTFDTAGTGNSFAVNGLAATANTGTGAVVRATSPTLVTPALGTPSALVGTNVTGVPIDAGTINTLPVNRGGTGTTTPSIVAGTNVTVSGTWPNQTVNASGGGSSDPSVSYAYSDDLTIGTTFTAGCTVSLPGGTLGTGGAANSKAYHFSAYITNVSGNDSVYILKVNSQEFNLNVAFNATVWFDYSIANNLGLTSKQSITPVGFFDAGLTRTPLETTAGTDSTSTMTLSIGMKAAAGTTAHFFRCYIGR